MKKKLVIVFLMSCLLVGCGTQDNNYESYNSYDYDSSNNTYTSNDSYDNNYTAESETDYNYNNYSSNSSSVDYSINSYDSGYDDVYYNEDYDDDHYNEDDDYAEGVDDAIDDWEDEEGEYW